MEFWRAIETLPPVEALKTSFVVYPLLSALHIAAIGAVFTAVVLMDVAILRAPRHDTATPDLAARLRPIALGAFFTAVLSGAALFSVNASEYVANPAFRIKLLLILAAGINLLAFDRAGGRARTMLAATSLMLWTGVLVSGRFIGFL